MQATTRRYTVLLYPEPDEDGYSVIVPLLDGCVTHGRTLDDALANAREAIEGHVATLSELGEEVPDEEAPPAVVTVEVTTRPSTSGAAAAATSH